MYGKIRAVIIVLFCISLCGCGISTDNSSTETTQGSEITDITENNNTELTQEYVCSEFGISESEFEGVDFNHFINYYGLTYENIHNEMVAYLLQEYKKNNGEIEFYDYSYMYNSDKDAVLTLDNQNSVAVVFFAQIEDDLKSFWIFDFEKGIKIRGTGAENVIHKDSIVATLTMEHKERVMELFAAYDVYDWYENSEELNPGEWYLSVKFQDGTIALVSGSNNDDVDFEGLLSEIKDIGEK